MFYFSRRAKASGRVGAALTIAALTLSLAQPIMLLALPSLARAVTVETIFEDGFESGNFDAWTLVENKWFINTTNAHSGTKKVNVQGSTTGDNSLIKDQSTVGYENLNLEYWYKADAESLEEGDQVIVEYTINGTDWVELLAIIDGVDDGEWHEDSHDLPVEANNNSDFAIRFRANLDAGNDTVRLDDVKLTGEALPLPGSIAGFKYHDEDANGEQGEGEDGLEDWEIALYDENGVNVMATTSTDSDGNFEFADVTPGNYRVCEVKTFPVGPHEPWWIQTEPAEDEESECFDGWRGYDITVEEEGEVIGLVFGNAEGAVIGGWKYADPDADGEHEDESDGVPGFTINLYQNDELLATKQTLDHPEQPGQYYFERLWPGEYLICEEQQTGWTQTGPTTTDDAHPVCDNEGTIGHLVTVDIGEWNYENLFHNRELEPGSIAGLKYHDEDANGEQGDGEDGLEDWEIALYDENGVNIIATTTTDSDGEFAFDDVAPGNYRVCEPKTFPSGGNEPWWIQTEPAENEQSACFDGWRGYDVMVAEGEEVSEGIIFGNAEGAVIGGWKYADPDADGEHEDESDGVPGFTINLYQNDELLATKQTLDHPEQPGQYYFERLWPGEYLICEEQQSGWVQTGPTTTDATHPLCDNEGTVGHLVTVVIGEWNYENHFHNRELPDVTGPRVEITSLTDGDIINGEVDIAGIIADANPGHYWLRIEDATSTAVNFSGGPGTVAQLISYDTETHLFTWDTDSLDGEYWIKLEARDSLGNKNPNLSPVPEGVAYPDATTTDSVHWIKVIVDEDYVPPSDETPPPLPIHLSPLDGTIRNTLGLILDFTDVLDDMSNPVTYYYQSAHDGATTTDNAFLTPIWNSALLSISENDGVGSPEAKYWWHVRACDTAGNCSLWTDAWTLTVDNTAPTTTITSPNPDSTFDSSILVEGYTNDNVGVGTTTLSSAIYDGEVCGTYADITVLTGVASTTFNWSYDWTPAEDGTYCIKGAGTDLAGNEEGSAIIFPVTYKKSVTPPPAPPEEEDDDGGGSSGGCYNCGGGSSIGGSTTTEETFGEGGGKPNLALGRRYR